MKKVELIRPITVVVRLAVLLSAALLVLVKAFNPAVGIGHLERGPVTPSLRLRQGDDEIYNGGSSYTCCGGVLCRILYG